MIVWGGDDDSDTPLNTGGRYDPAGNSWTLIVNTLPNTPAARDSHTAVWTGNEMIVWGGSRIGLLNDGGRYDPAANAGAGSWTAMPNTLANTPAARVSHTAVWTGIKMIVWGGWAGSLLNDGGRYDPAGNSWAAVSIIGAPAARNHHTAVWTGSEMIVWGGDDDSDTPLNTGGRYDPAGNNWTAASITGAPAARYAHTAVWTGSEMIVWGGYGGSGSFNDTYSYTPRRVLYLYQRP
jgi:N-acetylneuraminic acid mutarotase